MTVQIPVDFESFVQSIIARGSFQTETQVVGEALRLLQERERRLEELRAEVQIGLNQLQRGEFTDYDEDSLRGFFEEVKSEGQKQLNAGTAT
jgi:antitoxin ParD1/3/4